MPSQAHGFVLKRSGIAPDVAHTRSWSTSKEDTRDNYFLYKELLDNNKHMRLHLHTRFTSAIHEA
jgi:hypothetical protein